MNYLRIARASLFSVIGASLLAPVVQSAEPGPCKQIVEACKSAGFVQGDARKGYGLWADCVDPIVRGSAPPANADKPLPTVDPSVVAACKEKHPTFGERNKSAAAH